MTNAEKKLIADNINSLVGFRKITDFRTLYDMSVFFKQNGIHFEKGDVDILVTKNGEKIAVGHRHWSNKRVNLEYKELKPEIEWTI